MRCWRCRSSASSCLAQRLANGVAFNQRFIDSMLVPLIVAALAAAWCRHRHAALLLGLMLSSMAYQVWVGGDAWPYWRINAPFVPLVCALCICGVALLARRPAGWLAARRWRRSAAALEGAAAVAVMLALLRLVNADFLDEAGLAKSAYWVEANWENVDIALALGEVLRPTATIGVVWGGTIPYYSGFAAVDFLGKSDARVARLSPDLRQRPRAGGREARWRFYNPGHNKYDLTYSIIELRPTYVQRPFYDMMRPEVSVFLAERYTHVRYLGVALLLARGSPQVDWLKIKAARSWERAPEARSAP